MKYCGFTTSLYRGCTCWPEAHLESVENLLSSGQEALYPLGTNDDSQEGNGEEKCCFMSFSSKRKIIKPFLGHLDGESRLMCSLCCTSKKKGYEYKLDSE